MENLGLSTVRVQLNFYRTFFWLMFVLHIIVVVMMSIGVVMNCLENSTTMARLDDGMVRLRCEFESWEPRVFAGGRR